MLVCKLQRRPSWLLEYCPVFYSKPTTLMQPSLAAASKLSWLQHELSIVREWGLQFHLSDQYLQEQSNGKTVISPRDFGHCSHDGFTGRWPPGEIAWPHELAEIPVSFIVVQV